MVKYFVSITLNYGNQPDDFKWVKFRPKHNYVCFKNSVFGLFIGSWSSYTYLCWIIMLCKPNLHLSTLLCLSHFNWSVRVIWVCWARANRFCFLEQHGWTPVKQLNMLTILEYKPALIVCFEHLFSKVLV